MHAISSSFVCVCVCVCVCETDWTVKLLETFRIKSAKIVMLLHIGQISIKVTARSMRHGSFFSYTVDIHIQHRRDRAEKRYYVFRYFRKVHFCGQFVSFRDTAEGYEVIFERVSGRKGLEFLGRRKQLSYLPYKFYYRARGPRGYIIPRNFSDRTIHAVEFIRWDIFWLRERNFIP